MSEFMSYDPWRKVHTRNGIQGDLVISALQKSIRRGLAEEAVTFAYEMYITSAQFEDKLWRRLQAISVEDVGFGDLSAPVLINALNQMRQSFPYTDGDRPIFFVHAIRYLAAAKKDRSSDNLKNIVVTEFAHGRTPTIPDFALDMHTEQGRSMGRDFKHFLAEGSRVENEHAVDENYRDRLLALLERLEREGAQPQEGAFAYNAWQA
jgi:replication-associated recombination protein RarA